MPSDTIYGLSCRALDEAAVERLHKLKGRDKAKPFIVLVSSTTQLIDVGIITTDVAPALRYWPGRLTLICSAVNAPLWLHCGTKSLAIRQPDDKELRNLVTKVGPIISTSANLAGSQPAQSAAEARQYFSDKLDFYVDMGEIKSPPSTIAKVEDGKLVVIRQGAFTRRNFSA